jgi:uncharacterized protein
MSAFADSSALVKLYADEQGHQQIRMLEAVAVAQLARVEVPAALWRKQRLGELAAGDTRLLTAEFEADYFGTDNELPRFASVMITDHVLDEAARLCAVHGLRAYDGVQLSSAIAARDADPTCTTFAVFDHSLRTAAATEAFTLVPNG